MRKLSQEFPPGGPGGRGQVIVITKPKGQNRSLFDFFTILQLDVLGIILRRSQRQEAGFRLPAGCAPGSCMYHEVNALLDTEEINMLNNIVVLCMNRAFIQHMREIYSKVSRQHFNGILV